jgi:hypothetical protein
MGKGDGDRKERYCYKEVPHEILGAKTSHDL